MRTEQDYLRDFAVVLTEKGVVAISDPQQIAVYDFLCSGKKRPSDIADALGFPSSSLHFVLDKMVDQGVILRSKPDPSKKEVYYSNFALRIAGAVKPTPEKIAESEEAFREPDRYYTGLASVANMLESYTNEIGLDHSQLRARYATDLADAFKTHIGGGTAEEVMPRIKERFNVLTGFKMSVFALTPITVVFEGDRTMRTKMDILSVMVKRMIETSTGKNLAVKSIEDFSNDELVRYKVIYDRGEIETETYINTSLPQTEEPEKFMVVDIEGSVALLMNDIQCKLVETIYERPLCVTDIVNMVGMPRSTVTTNLLRMVEEGVASVFYSESGAMYYGLSCAILMKRTRRLDRDSTPTRNAIRSASADGGFMEGYLLYLLASLKELGFDTDYMMVVLGAKYMRAAGRDGPKNFDSYFGKMSDIAKIVGLSLNVVSVYPLTIGISKSGDSPVMAPAMTFVKGMAHQGLEMASSGIFVRVSEETPDDMKVSFKEIYPSLSMTPIAEMEAEALAEPAPAVKKRTSSVRDALRNRSARVDGKPLRTVRYITSIATVVFAVMILAIAAGGGADNTASAESYSIDAKDGISIIGTDGMALELPFSVKANEAITFTIEVTDAKTVGTVVNGIACPMDSLFGTAGGAYTVTMASDITLTELKEVEVPDGLTASLYDFGRSVGDSYAYNFGGYIPAEEYAEQAGALWVSEYAWVLFESPSDRYIAMSGTEGVYFDRICVPGWTDVDATVAKLPSDHATIDMEGAYEVYGFHVEGQLNVAKTESLSMKFVATDGPVKIVMEQNGRTTDLSLGLDRFVSVPVSQDIHLTYEHVGIQ